MWYAVLSITLFLDCMLLDGIKYSCELFRGQGRAGDKSTLGNFVVELDGGLIWKPTLGHLISFQNQLGHSGALVDPGAPENSPNTVPKGTEVSVQ